MLEKNKPVFQNVLQCRNNPTGNRVGILRKISQIGVKENFCVTITSSYTLVISYLSNILFPKYVNIDSV